MHESLSLPVNVCYPGNGQKEDPGETREACSNKAELSSSPSLSPSQGDSVESSGSPSLSPPIHSSSPQSPSGFMRNVKKRESKGRGKELRGMQRYASCDSWLLLLHRLIITVSLQRSLMSLPQQENLKDDFQTLGKYLS